MCEPVAVREESVKKNYQFWSHVWSQFVPPERGNFCEVCLIFLFGVAIEQSLTDSLKFAIGRLRPHFLDVCRPNYATVSCTDEQGQPRYVTEDVCTETDFIKSLNIR